MLTVILLSYLCDVSPETPDGVATLEHIIVPGSSPDTNWAELEEQKRAIKAAHPIRIPASGLSAILLAYPCAVSDETPGGTASVESIVYPGTDPGDAWSAFEIRKRASKIAHPLVT